MSEDISNPVPSSFVLGRREFFVTSIFAGFALAVQPIQAQTQIEPDTKDLIAGEIKIPLDTVQ